MSHIILIADGTPFSSQILKTQPLGGAETAAVRFMEALARAGHRVTVYNTIKHPEFDQGIHWKPLTYFTAQSADIVIAHRSPHLLTNFPVNAHHSYLYLHNPAGYLNKWKHRKALYHHKPDIIFSGHYHASTWPKWLPTCRHIIIPYAVDDIFQQTSEQSPPTPRAIFISNPLRSLDWLLDVWQHKIHPALPQATLDLYCGPQVYPGLKPAKKEAMDIVLNQARALTPQGVVLHQPLPRTELITKLQQARVMLYRGDPGESFCLALAEAQALGIPAVIQDIGSCSERIYPNKTGFIADTQQQFADQAIRLLSDDELWLTQHRNAQHYQRQYNWDKAARLFETAFQDVDSTLTK